MHWILNVKYVKDYLLEVTFNDNSKKIINFQNIIDDSDIFKPLQDIEYFKKVKIDSTGNTICWDNGADICPNLLYDLDSTTV